MTTKTSKTQKMFVVVVTMRDYQKRISCDTRTEAARVAFNCRTIHYPDAYVIEIVEEAWAA